MTTTKESKKGLSTSELIVHIRNKHGLIISEENDVDLLNMGYYHAYKRFRYVKKANADGRLRLTSFNEIIATYQFDKALKELFYPLLMTIETGLKNRAIESLVAGTDSGLDDFLESQMNVLKNYVPEDKKFPIAQERYEATKTNLLETVAYYSDKNDSIKHYLSSDYQIPIWVLFEVISFGQFSKILGCLTSESKQKLHEDVNLIPNVSNDMELLVNSLIELRNATMHNNAVFDANFSSGVPKKVKKQIQMDLGLGQSSFQCQFIEDYLIVLIWSLLKISVPKAQVRFYVDRFVSISHCFDEQLHNRDVLFKILSTNHKSKIEKLTIFLDNY
ncbi:TPA: Abi family protein [Streptococcus suis]|nr:Abi family protein [Streptococcus suis]HEM4083478.1 Abi family protein [Streptococcus suis]